MNEQNDQEILKKLKEQESKSSKSKREINPKKTNFPLGVEDDKQS